jgi:anthranilate/para-aminobenzoate synthase component I
LDVASSTLQDDEQLVFLWGYDAAVCVDERLPRRSPHGVVDAAWWRCRPARSADDGNTAVPGLHLTVAPHAQQRHIDRIGVAHTWLRDGVIYQANLAHRLKVGAISEDQARAFFVSKLAAQQPVCAAWIDLGDEGALVSLSPERLLAFDLGARTITTHPIKGTRPRASNDRDDEAMRATLHGHDKDRAEHVMIVDLLRNDLSRVCQPGTVAVTSLMHALSTATVHHMESTIAGTLQDNVTLGSILAATTPGGSITGAPKSTAIEAIATLEDASRGPYTGVLGVIDARGVGVCSLLIRTWLWRPTGDGELWVGGGIVVDSDAIEEWQETLAKARAFGVVT